MFRVHLLEGDLTDAVVSDAESLLVVLNVLEHCGPTQTPQWQLVRHKALSRYI